MGRVNFVYSLTGHLPESPEVVDTLKRRKESRTGEGIRTLYSGSMVDSREGVRDRYQTFHVQR